MKHLAEARTFQSADHLNAAVRLHVKRIAEFTNETDYIVLTFIARHAVKYPGAAQLKADTIAASVGKSNATVRRSLRKLVTMNVIRKQDVLRPKSGGRGANILIILPYVDQSNEQSVTAENDDNVAVESPKTETEATDKAKNSSNKNTNHTVNELDASYLRGSIPAVLYDNLAPFFNVKDLFNIVGTIFKAKASVCQGTLIENHPDLYTDALKGFIRHIKNGKVGNMYAYLYRTIQRTTHKAIRPVVHQSDVPKTRLSVLWGIA